jgi:hypothetical protein
MFNNRHNKKQKSHNVICDVCGWKVKAKDCVLITDKYSPQNGLLVCKRDVDKVPPTLYPFKIQKERPLDPKLVRPDSDPTFVYALTADDMENPIPGSPPDRTASAPMFLLCINGTPESVELIWQGPDDVGSGTATGYRIQRESPVGGGFSTLETTNTVYLYYKDTTAAASTTYNYRVAVVNSAGVGAYSEPRTVTTGPE